jgi:hypothetical protein
MTTKSKTITEQKSALNHTQVSLNDIYELDAEAIYEPDESDIYEPFGELDYEEYHEEQVNNEHYYCLESMGYIEWMLDGNTRIESLLKMMESNLTLNIGEKSYRFIMWAVAENIRRLKQEKFDVREHYEYITGNRN